ncbi:hypothetical protein [Streptomyces sp. NPDC053755]|uniref:hypothetical protein n=1 Tax=Streptomyces sp. NPDC053755 TaxID=3155815 RepID=UPI00342564C9
MYLVHVHLRRPVGGHVPEEIGVWVSDVAAFGRVEHVAVHLTTPARPVLGVYLLADRLEEAEELALTACRRVVAERPELRGWQVVEGYVPLLAPVYESFVGVAGPAAVDESVQGRFRPQESSSPGPELGES